jgi:hypothetical protein
MIETSGGHSRSVRTVDEALLDALPELKGLDPDEVAAIMEYVRNLDVIGEDYEKTLSSLEYTSQPVDIETFLTNDYFFGRLGIQVFPKLIDDLFELFSGEYYEALVTGAIGWGKTTIVDIAELYSLYQTSLLRSPQKTYGQMETTSIVMAFISITLKLAKHVVFGELAAMLNAIPYFREQFPFAETQEELRFPSNIYLSVASSQDTSVLGQNVISAVVDETNFMDYGPKNKGVPIFGSRIYGKAEGLYYALSRRMQSRYLKHGKLPGILFLVSSKRSKTDFLDRKISEVKNDPHVFVRDYSLWDTREQVFLQSKRFRVFVGNERIPSRILSPGEEPLLEEGCFIIEVPEDFRKNFEDDIDGSLRDFAGISTTAINPFIHRREKIAQAFDRGRERKNPFRCGGSLVHMSGERYTIDWDYLCTTNERGERVPRECPDAPRFVHIDTSKSGDRTGVVIAHSAGKVRVARQKREESEENVLMEYFEEVPVIRADLTLAVQAPPGGEISFAEIRGIIYDFIEHGFHILKITMDTYQSADSIQQFNARGIEATIQSVDTTPEPYRACRTSLYEDRAILYHYYILEKELRELQYDVAKQKIDHPEGGSKDVADGLAGVTFQIDLHTVSGAELPEPRLGISESPEPEDEGPKGDAWVIGGLIPKEQERGGGWRR